MLWGIKMRLKDGLVLQEVAGQFVIVATGKRVQEVPGIVYISSFEAHLWDYMEDHEFEKEDLVDIVMKKNDGETREKPLTDVNHFLNVLTTNNILDGSVEHSGIPKEINERLWKQHRG